MKYREQETQRNNQTEGNYDEDIPKENRSQLEGNPTGQIRDNLSININNNNNIIIHPIKYETVRSYDECTEFI